MNSNNRTDVVGATPTLDAILNPHSELDELLDLEGDAQEHKQPDVVIEIPVGSLDPRLKRMSYSSNNTLHECPRRYQLYKLNAMQNPYDDTVASITFGFGHVVGQGVQSTLEGKTKEQVYMDCFMMWNPDLYAEDKRAKKSFFLAMAATEKFNFMRNTGFLADYELMYFQGKPALELGFIIEMPDGFLFRGFVDAVLRHKVTGEIVVLELKTTKYREVNPAMYKNSAQAIGYSVILDLIVPGLSSYTVDYLVYSSTAMEYIEFPFTKSLLQRAHWLRNLLYDKHLVELYSTQQDQFPQYGDACFAFFRECPYLSLCGMDTVRLAKPYTEKLEQKMLEDDKKYQYRVRFEDLVAAQLEKET